MGFVQSFNRKELTKGLYVCGNFQVGKTYYLAATANLCADNDIDCLLIYFPDLIRELKSSMGKSSFEEKINMLKQVDVLMLDDLGAEFASNWTRDEILCPILNYRLQERLPVFISSNYTLEGLRNFYKSLDDNSNNADRIIARIKALATYIEMPGK